ncbi:phosphatidylglycerophosphatase A family protein [Desulfurivibrio alkaliphilus]|uniref:Phosphatidylglycerophosphatase A n=1 Tax=Desulfurivibrio alkaliphilus (strain DSM 19089 / UNIQEM U267 / AHT2) TaxID=589865 RepID=D6YZR1_DESAT|nr:phosphatidylglycerophosphatase A [Desulfurivibrio alkaliphilus]ADH85068.1 phosphatidylglycerophosphatase A [Desulfurivibrio alkaliphilus AHT 2]
MDKLIMLLATGFGLGRLPKAPGTWGTLAAFPVHWAIMGLSWQLYALSLAGIIVLAVIISGMAEKILDRPDPGMVVIDEVAGMLIALIAVPATFTAWLLAFVLFRFFDILKPFPIRFIDRRCHGGLGIVLDDLLAGLYALGCIHLLLYFFPAIGGA